MKKILNDKIWPAIWSEVEKAISTRSEKNLSQIKSYFSAGRKFDNLNIVNNLIKHPQKFIYPKADFIQEETGYVLNPFQAQSHNMILDLLTDSGTNTLTEDQIKFKNWYLHAMPPIQINAYAGLTPKSHLNDLVRMIFGQQFNFNLTLQGRAAEKLVLGALCGAQVIKAGDKILSNRPFDTTKGQIQIRGLEVEALTPIPNPEAFINADSVFMGNLKVSELEKHNPDTYNTILLTMTDNGSGGQPVSMANVKEVAAFAKKHKKLFWIDACRIFENAAFIKAFEPEYANHTMNQIVKQVANFCDIMTMSFKKIYSHGGGGIFVNRNSKIIGDKIELIDRGIKNATTADYGNGFDSYSGITGQQIIEIISGLICGINENIVASRIAQLGYVGMVMRKNFNLPVISGGHAIYIASDQVLQNVPLENCPAEYLNAILMNALQVRGCGLGHIVYSKREYGKIVSNDLSMDSLRLAIPRQTYTNQQILERMSILGKAYKQGLFKSLKGGLVPLDYVNDGFYHFGARYELVDKNQFDDIIKKIKTMRQ